MKREYKFQFLDLNIIEEQKEEYNSQSGGYNEMTHNQIIELWQNPDYNETFINFYSLVNKYLRKTEIKVKSEWLVALKLESKKDFYNFIIYYINKLTNIIYKNISTEKKFFYRGEIRKSFNHGVGEILYFPTFQSVSASISTAYKFSESSTGIKILFVIEIGAGFHYKPLYTHLKIYDYKKKITQIINEKEYIVMPNSYYVIVEKSKIYNDVNLIKLRLCDQKYYQINESKLCERENIFLKKNQIKNFNSVEANNFMKKSVQYQKMVDYLISMKDYQISKNFYNELNNSDLSNMFSVQIEPINKLLDKITSFNALEIMEEIKKLGIGYYEYEKKHIEKYKKKIERISIIINTNFKSVEELTVYGGFYNFTSEYKKPEFIEFLKGKEYEKEYLYDKILITNLNSSAFLYDDIYNSDFPHVKIKKNKSSAVLYYKYLLKINLSNVKICVCSSHSYEYCNNIILIPNYKIKIVKKEKKINKHDLPYILYTIDLIGY
jgi:hypothetical protein